MAARMVQAGPSMSTSASQPGNATLVRRLNRLIVAGYAEVMTLSAAARIVESKEGSLRLTRRAQRRGVFRQHLDDAVVTLGGVPAKRAAWSAFAAAWARGLRRLLAGVHEGDAYAACARATERTTSEYARALERALPSDVRLGLEREQAEIQLDGRELRRLRWGAAPAPA